ncbi:MAG: signal peptidase II [Bdellovibrionales bacterium]|nr:signal peptidase II [Bdellovibrionales bacterium]
MKKRDWFWVLTSLFGVIAADQISKYVILEFSPRWHWEIFHLSLHYNKGAMLGLFSELPPVLRIVSLSTGGAFLFFSFIIFQYLLPTRSMTLRVGMSILIGGILGNVIDRIVWGHVVDFLIIGNEKMATGVFNVADALQWLGYFTMGYAMLRDREKLWPKDNLRKDAWVDPKFQLRYCYILVTCGLGFSLISGVFSYTFLRFVVIDLIGNNKKLLDQFLIPFLVTFTSFSMAFSAFLFMVGKKLSHRIVGPVYAFERFINDYIQGKSHALKLRKGDEFLQLEDIAELIRTELQINDQSQVIPILPEGLADDAQRDTNEQIGC